MAEINDLSTTDASNTARFPENMAPSAVNNGARALEGMISRWFQAQGGENIVAIADVGVNSLSVSLARASLTATASASHYIDGLTLAFRMPSTITDNLRLSASGHLKKSTYKMAGGAATSLSSSDLIANQHVVFRYSNALEGWLLLTPTARAIGPAANTFEGTQTISSAAINEAKGADIASAATTDIGAATGNYVNVTGTTTITALGTVQAGTRRIVQFSGALILTHNATSLILPSAANITTAAGDCAVFVSEGSGNWRCVEYAKANGQAVVGTSIATQAEMETATDVAKAVSPGRTQYHPGVGKAWIKFDGTSGSIGTGSASYNMDAVTDNGTGDWTVNFTTDFSGAEYAFHIDAYEGAESIRSITAAAGSLRFSAFNSAGAAADYNKVCVVAFGDQ